MGTSSNPYSFIPESPYTFSSTSSDDAKGSEMDEAVSALGAASPGGTAASIVGTLGDVTGDLLDYFGDGDTEQAQYAAQAAQAQAQAQAIAAATTPIGWATANPLTAGAVVLGCLYLLTKIAGK